MMGSDDNKFNGGFIARMVDYWKPVMTAIGPVIAKESAIAIFIFANDQAVLRNALVVNFDGKYFIFLWLIDEDDF